MGVTKSQTRLSNFHYVKRITRSLIEIQSGDQKGALSHPVRTEEPKKEGKKDSLLRKDSANEKTGTLLPRALPHCTQPVTLMAIIKEYRSRWEYLRGTQDNKKGSSIPVRVGPATYFVGPSAEINAEFHVMNNIVMPGQSHEPGAGPTGSAWVTSQEASPG